jgi:hypothetical protein
MESVAYRIDIVRPGGSHALARKFHLVKGCMVGTTDVNGIIGSSEKFRSIFLNCMIVVRWDDALKRLII